MGLVFCISRQRTDEATVIRVAGTLDSAARVELGTACDGARQVSTVVRLDLSEVVFADQSVVELLLDLERQGVELTDLPLLLRTQLEGDR